MIENPMFDTNVNGWTLSGSSTMTFDSGRAKVKSDRQWTCAYRDALKAIINGHKYYLALDLDSPTTTQYITLNAAGGPIVQKSATGAQRVSGILTAGSSGAQNRIEIGENLSSGWGYFWVDNIVVIDLTEWFGSGNEPTKATMDTLMTQIPNKSFNVYQVVAV